MAEKILVALLHGIGDSLMAAPALQALKEKHPRSTLTAMTIKQPVFNDLWKHQPCVDDVLFSSLDYNPRYGSPFFWVGDYWRIKSDIKNAVKRYGFTQTYFVTLITMPSKVYEHIDIQRYREHKTLKIARELGVELGNNRYTFRYGDEDRKWVRMFLSEHKLDSEILVGLHVSGSTPNKSLPADATHSLIKMLQDDGYKIVVFHSKGSYERDKENLPHEEGVFHFVSDNLLHSAALVDQCQFLVCVDSGVGHIAAGLNKRLFSIFFKKMWMKNSLALGDDVHPYFYNGDLQDFIEHFLAFLA